ncbi:MAG TPA: hypothetical protein ENJ95_06270 [Bacteroidetes bacterium]|nr:hypothetical protein [Bacteroidota bacterium]
MKNLIEKYFDGKTSLQEEAELRAYFNSDQVEESLQQYQPLFQYFKNEKEVQLSEGFEAQLFEKMEGGAKVVKMKTWRPNLLRIAAVGAVLLAAFLYFYENKNTPPQHAQIDWSKYEVTNETMALKETEKAFEILASSLNKGKNKTAKELAKTEPAAKYLN